MGEDHGGDRKVIVAIYLEAEDFEAMKKVGLVIIFIWPKSAQLLIFIYAFPMSVGFWHRRCFQKVARLEKSDYVVNAIKHFNELYQRPTFLIRSRKHIHWQIFEGGFIIITTIIITEP